MDDAAGAGAHGRVGPRRWTWLLVLLAGAAAWAVDGLLVASLEPGPDGARLPVGDAGRIHLVVAAGYLLSVGVGAWWVREMDRRSARLDSVVTALGAAVRGEPVPDGVDESVAPVVAAMADLGREVSELRHLLLVDASEQRAILTALDAGVLNVDVDGHVLRANATACQLLGLTGEPVGRKLRELTRLSGLLQAVSEARTGVGRVSVECQVPGTDDVRILQVAASLVEGEDGPCVVVLRDLTERRRLEQVRQDFVANVSHELKTPLTTMRSYLETVLDDPDMPADVREGFLEKVQKSTNRLTSIVTDLLDLTRIESTRGALQRELLDLYALASESVTLLQPSAEARSVVLRLAGAGGPWIVEGNDKSLSLAIQNLIDNAVKYSPEGGVVTVSVEGGDRQHVLSVQDQGPGIPESERERIFERFYCIDKTRSRALGGTGLGLSIVRNAVRSHGGEVEVASSLGQGSSFRVRLPRAAGKP